MAKIFLFFFFTIFAFSKNILLLNSYSSTFDWTREQTSVIINTLEEQPNTKLFVEYMDTKVFKLTREYEKTLYQYYTKKYKNYNIDIVIVTDDNALEFIMKYKDNLFKNSKIFFSGINNLSLANQLDKNIYSGVFEQKDPITNLEIAKTINKKVKTIYLISDDTNTAKKEILYYKKHYKDIENINFVYYNNKNIEVVLEKLKDYDENSLMMLLVFTGFNKNNKHMDGKSSAQSISQIYKNPILIHTNTYIDIPKTNIVGGNCTDPKSLGETVANYVVRYIKGEKLQTIGFNFTEGNNNYFNFESLKKFNINEKNLRKYNPIIITRDNSFYELYSFYIHIFILISVVILIFTITVMIKNNTIKNLNNSLEIKVQHALSKLKEQHTIHQDEIIRNTKFSTIGQMSAGITHEINTPLTYLKGTNEMMQFDLEDMPDNNFKKRLIEDNQKIKNGINRIALIVESMREMSQTAPQTTEEFNVYSSMITMLRMSYNRSKLITKIYINGELFELENSDKEKYVFKTKGQRQRLEQVWTIILNNALDELVKIENFNDRKIEISISWIDEKIYVLICDNAGGISKEILENIFEPFTSTKESSGIGIGLNVAKKILEEHGASIVVENKNKGACFTVILEP